MSQETKNVFERRRPQPTLAADQQNKFERHQENINEQRRNTTTHDANVAKLAEHNSRWVNKIFQPVGAGGTPLTPELIALKGASDSSRATPTAAPISINLETLAATLAALIRDWKANSANGKNLATLFEDNDWNSEQLSNATQYLIQEGHPINSQLPEDAFQLCYDGGHLDPRKRRDRAGNVVHLRGEAARPAPVAFPRVIWPDEAAAVEREQQEKAVATAAVETARAKSLPFDQLKKEATKDRKSARPEMGPVVVT
jgi:hypothetical protein